MRMRPSFVPAINAIWRTATLISLLAGVSLAQQSTVSSAPPEPGELVRKTVDNEIKASRDDSAHFMFRSTKTTSKGSVTKIYIETKQATAGMVVAYNGMPLTPEQRKAELGRIDRFLKNPEELEKKHRQEQQDADRTMRIVRALPDAFLYEYAGQQQGSATVGKPGDSLVILKFRPDPRYEPPSRVELALTGMEGELLLDTRCHRLASIDGHLFKEVGFGWGILGHLDKGGHFVVGQGEVAPNHWEITHMNLDFTGKVLLFKGLSIKSDEVYSDFHSVT